MYAKLGVAHVPGMPGTLPHHRRSRHSRRMRNPQFCVSGETPMLLGTYKVKRILF